MLRFSPGAMRAPASDASARSANTVMSLVPLPKGDLLVPPQTPGSAGCGRTVARVGSTGPPQADFSGQFDKLSVSNDGTQIGFGFEPR